MIEECGKEELDVLQKTFLLGKVNWTVSVVDVNVNGEAGEVFLKYVAGKVVEHLPYAHVW